MLLDYADLQAALKTTRHKLTLHERLMKLDLIWRVYRTQLVQAEAACARMDLYADAASRQWATDSRDDCQRHIDAFRADLTAILHGAPVAGRVTSPGALEPVECITQATLL